MKFSSEKGLTFVEWIVVTIMIGIFLAVAIPKYLQLRDDARSQAHTESCKQNQASIETAASIGYANNAINTGEKRYPVSMAKMVELELLDTMPTCPSGGTYTYDNKEGEVTCTIENHKKY